MGLDSSKFNIIKNDNINMYRSVIQTDLDSFRISEVEQKTDEKENMPPGNTSGFTHSRQKSNISDSIFIILKLFNFSIFRFYLF